MWILVTGGAGMIGSHLVDALLDGGNEIVVVDNFLTGRRREPAHLAVSAPGAHRRSRHVDGTASSSRDCRTGHRVYHLASPASPVDYARHPLETLMTNAVGTRNALDVARRWHARFLVTSTSEIYGDPEQHPQPETYHGNVNSLGPRSCYDEGKRFAESLTMTYWRSYGVDVRIARLFNTYGPRSRSDDGQVVPTFCVQALSGQPLTIFGSGLQTRSLCYVSDTVAWADGADGDARIEPAKSSISVVPRAHHSRNSARRSRHSRAVPARSSADRCRSTIRPGAARTSPRPNASWDGARRPTSPPGLKPHPGLLPRGSRPRQRCGGVVGRPTILETPLIPDANPSSPVLL